MKKDVKKGFMVVSLVLLTSAAVFASGNKDDDTANGPGRRFDNDGPRREMMDGRPGGRFADPSICYDDEGNPIELEEISAEGALVLEEGTMPYLNTADGKVFLMVPRFTISELELTGGESVKVSGYDVPRTPWGQETESTFLRVTDAEIDGKQIVLMGGAGGRGRHGGRGGRGGAPGKGGW